MKRCGFCNGYIPEPLGVIPVKSMDEKIILCDCREKEKERETLGNNANPVVNTDVDIEDPKREGNITGGVK